MYFSMLKIAAHHLLSHAEILQADRARRRAVVLVLIFWTATLALGSLPPTFFLIDLYNI
jgi:hypothetical protein